jgi:hypothetical protein
MTTMIFTRKDPPQWLLDFWKEIDDKTFGKGFDRLAHDAVCNLGVADWHGREAIRGNLRQFIDRGFTATTMSWSIGTAARSRYSIKVRMTFDDPALSVVRRTTRTWTGSAMTDECLASSKGR